MASASVDMSQTKRGLRHACVEISFEEEKGMAGLFAV
jgi:hypothetical protein